MTDFSEWRVPANATALVTLDPLRAVVAMVDLTAEQPKAVYLPVGDSLHWVDDDGTMRFIYRTSAGNDASVELTYTKENLVSEENIVPDQQDRAGGYQDGTGAALAGEKGPEAVERPRRGNPILQYFSYEHLKNDRLKSISGQVADLAWSMYETLPDGPEKSAGLRHLLEAKDCFVRAAL